MKLKNKIAAIMILIGVGIILLTSIFYYFWSHQILLQEEQNSIIEISESVSQKVDAHFSEVTHTVQTLSSAPIIRELLLESNSDFAALSDYEREDHIASLGKKWTETNDLTSPFLKTYLNNSVSDYLNLQKELIPERYGEIFITNRYGVIIASTNKLTTISHAHKYWWIAGYEEGQGRIFLDDRGFDTSAEGYVLGIVVPIKHENEIIGIIKSNVNIINILNQVIESYENLYENSKVQIVRTEGLVVSERGVTPLSTVICDQMLEYLKKKKPISLNIEENGLKHIVGVSEIPITMGTESIGFGGSYESIDHIKGNTGESWHSVVCLDEKTITANAEKTSNLLLVMGVIFTFATSIIALYFGNRISKPIVALSRFSQAVGAGELNNRINLDSNDEIGLLANSYNDMVENLQNTMASKKDLLAEVEKRKKVEEELKKLSITDELTGIYNRRAANEFLRKNIEKAQRYNEKLSVLLLDIDRFKNINDTYGHDFGDTILISLTRILSKNIRHFEMVARIGGEEFLIILPQINREQAFILAERLRIIISEYDFERIEQLTVSIGVSEYKSDDTFDSLLKRVDDGLYDSKEGGRNKVTLL